MGKGSRGVSVILGLLTALVMGPGLATAGQSCCRGYVDGASRKLGRGIANILTAPLELIREPHLVTQQDGGMAGATVGIVRGLVMGVAREAAGLIEVVTFPIPIPSGFCPVLNPEFVFAMGDWSP